jgi:hypothetical protein
VVKRLRRRVAPLGLRIHTVPRLGFLLDYTPTARPEDDDEDEDEDEPVPPLAMSARAGR